MLDASVVEGTNVVSVVVGGAIRADQQAAARATVEAVMAEHGSVRMLLDFGGIDVGRAEPRAAWEDVKDTRLLDDMDRVAVIADSSLIDEFNDVIAGPSPYETRTFRDRGEAVAWLTS